MLLVVQIIYLWQGDEKQIFSLSTTFAKRSIICYYDDIEDYVAEENDIEKCDVYSELKDLEEYHEKIYELLSEMGDNEIEYMISCQTGNAYYQDFLKLDENGNEIEVETMAKTSEAKMRANKKYEKAHIRQILLKFHKTHDAAIIEKLDSLDSKNNYVRQLILKDLEREKKEATNKQPFFIGFF